MKIAVFSWRCIKNPEAGGSELYFHELAKRWAKWGHNVTWFTSRFKNSLKEENYDGIKILRQGGRLGVYISSALAYLKRSDNKFDIIIDVENGIPFFTPIYTRAKKILHIHHIHKDVWFREMPFHLAILGRILESFVMPRLYKKVSVVTISKSSAAEILKEKATKRYPRVVNPGIEFYDYKKKQKAKNPTVLFMNRIKKYKGLKTLLDSVVELRRQGRDNINVWIAGDGSDLDEMKYYSHKNKLQKVRFFGRVSEEKKKDMMQKSWIFINPSFKEGWGIVNIEANYFGTPVIGSNVEGIRDSVVEGKTGLLFGYGDHKELAEKIIFLIDSNKKREEMSKKGREWSRKFDWDIKAKEYLSILKEEFSSHILKPL